MQTLQLPRSSRRGFSMIELLVVMAIIGLLLALLLPAVQRSREAARMVECKNHLKHLALSIHGFHDTYQKLPPSRMDNKLATWAVLILPYLEQAPVYDQWRLDKKYYEQNDTARLAVIPGFYCPSRRSAPAFSTVGDVDAPSTTHVPGTLIDYAVSSGNGPVTEWAFDNGSGAIIAGFALDDTQFKLQPTASRTRLRDILDGTSQTLLLGEKHVPSDKYGQLDEHQGYADGSAFNGDSVTPCARAAGKHAPFAKDRERSIVSFGSSHVGIIHFALCDGSVRGISYATDLSVMDALATRARGEIVGDF